jgi:hypothetical protein
MRSKEMSKMLKTKLLPLALAISPAMMACATEPATDGTDETSGDEVAPLDTEHLGEVSSALCLAPPTPPSYDLQWILSESNPSDAVYVDPDNGECDAYVINARFVDDLEVTVTDAATTADRCVGTSLYVRRYLKSASGWSYEGTSTVTGVWTIDGCRLPKLTWFAHTTSDARIHITTKRTYTSGQFGVLLRGLPFVARATKFYNPPPN